MAAWDHDRVGTRADADAVIEVVVRLAHQHCSHCMIARVNSKSLLLAQVAAIHNCVLDLHAVRKKKEVAQRDREERGDASNLVLGDIVCVFKQSLVVDDLMAIKSVCCCNHGLFII